MAAIQFQWGVVQYILKVKEPEVNVLECWTEDKEAGVVDRRDSSVESKDETGDKTERLEGNGRGCQRLVNGLVLQSKTEDSLSIILLCNPHYRATLSMYQWFICISFR